jgi:hypothetical protein
VWSVLLDHATGEVIVTVETAPGTYRNEVMLGRLEGSNTTRGASDFAAGTLARLADTARPPLGAEGGRRYNERIWPFARSEGRRWTNWESATWQLGVRSLEARVFRFAYAWTGLSVDDRDRYIGVTAFNLGTSSVRLAEVSGEQYDWDFSRRFSIDGLDAQRRTRPDVQAALRSTGVQPDHHRLLGADGD